MDDRCAVAFLGLQDETERNRVVFGHVGAHDDDAVRVGQVPLWVGRGAAAEGGAQTGHRRAMSYAGLVFDEHHAESAAAQLLDQVIFLVVEGGPTKLGHSQRVVDDGAVG
jgi:hypothetical protein